jgi:hypothetical protein
VNGGYFDDVRAPGGSTATGRWLPQCVMLASVWSAKRDERVFDLGDLVSVPRTLVLGVLRVLWWLGWDFGVRTVGWSIGWVVLRGLSLGRFPQEPLDGVDDASAACEVFVDLLGLALIALGIWLLSGHGP